MTSEEHQSILKAAVSYAIEETKRICFAEMDQAMAELTEAHVASARDAIQRARAEQAAELAKFKALAETLAGALEQMHRAVCHETGFAEAVRADSGLAYPWEPLDVAADASLKALRQYKEAANV